MENNARSSRSPSLSAGSQKLYILTQLLQVSMTMRHFDEMLVWLAYMIVEHFDVQVIQFWANQTLTTGQDVIVLRTMVCQDKSLPPNAIGNAHLAAVAARLLQEGHGIAPQPIDTPLSSYQSNLLSRYGLNYWFGHFLRSDGLLPPPKDQTSSRQVATPLTAIALLFLRYPPPYDFPQTTGHILEQAVAVAKRHGLLLPPGTYHDFPSL